MNFKTTILLIILLIIAGIAVYFVQKQPATPVAQTTRKNLLDISQDNVQKVVITPAQGQAIAIERAGSDWEITQPVHAKADTFTAGDLVRELCTLQSHAQVGSEVDTGVNQPRYTVVLTTKDGKTVKLAVGEKSGVGDNLYIRVNDQPKTDVISTELETYLTKSVNDYRDMNLVSVPSTRIDHLTLEQPDQKIELVRHGSNWEMTSPDHWSADPSQMETLLTSLTSLRANDFVDHPASASSYQFNQPALVVNFSVEPPPSTSKPATRPAQKKIVFGRYDNILKKNVFVQIDGEIARVSADSLTSLEETPLELRNRQVLDIDSAKVEKIEITRDLPATTQPTSRPASNVDVVITRNHPASKLATTRSTTLPATASTRPATQPATKPTPAWIFPHDASATVDVSAVNDLLSALHPLRADNYRAKLPTTLPADHFELTITAGGKTYTIKIYSAPTGEENAIAVYDHAIFEVPVTFVDHLKSNFKQ